MTVAPSRDRNAAEGLCSRDSAMHSSATAPPRKGILQCSRVLTCTTSNALPKALPHASPGPANDAAMLSSTRHQRGLCGFRSGAAHSPHRWELLATSSIHPAATPNGSAVMSATMAALPSLGTSPGSCSWRKLTRRRRARWHIYLQRPMTHNRQQHTYSCSKCTQSQLGKCSAQARTGFSIFETPMLWYSGETLIPALPQQPATAALGRADVLCIICQYSQALQT